MEIKSALINSKQFKGVKNSIIEQASKDGEVKPRVKTIEYINNTSYNNDDRFFYDMLVYTRFLDPTSTDVAFTNTVGLIFLNCPGSEAVKTIQQWEFVYDHECLHQLWDTFAVGEKIKKAGIEYDHYILNIASDCVINDYLSRIRKKKAPEGGITKELLKEKFDVDYEPRKDTQYTLYLKLLKVANELRKDKQMQNAANDMSGQGGQDSQNTQSGQGGQGSQGGQGGQGGKGGQGGQGNQGDNKADSDIDNMSGDEAANEAQRQSNLAEKGAENAQNNANGATGGDADKAKEDAQKAKEAAQKAKEAAQKAKECADKGDEEGARKAAKEARKYAKEALKNAQQSNSSSGHGDAAGVHDVYDEDLDEIRKGAEAIIEKYKKKISGKLREFINKCTASEMLKPNGMEVKIQKGNGGWNTQLESIVNGYVKQKIFKTKRLYQQTYSRVKRGSGFIKFGEPIVPGRKVREDKFDVSIGFYVDVSGSMGNDIEKVWKTVYKISKSLEKIFSRESVIEKFAFKLFAFDTNLHKLEWGKKMNANGGTMPLEQLLRDVVDNTKSYLINVVITDADMSIDINAVKKTLKSIEGMLIWISNSKGHANANIIDLTKNGYGDKLSFVLAPGDWDLD